MLIRNCLGHAVSTGRRHSGQWLVRALHAGASFALAAAASANVTAHAAEEVRVAVVIGNASYENAPLANPVKDAQAMGDSLRSLGFTVIEVRDASRSQMQAAIVQAREALQGRAGVGLLYFAGHGIQVDWHNYMVPVDSRFSRPSEVAAETVDAQSVLDAFRAAGNRLNIVILDACRDNPFDAVASGKGLAQMDAPPSTLLAYATAPGNVAEDSDASGEHGLYTAHLLQEMVRPGAGIEDVFKRVRLKVRQGSSGRQIPWESTSLEEEFIFAGAGGSPRPGSDRASRDPRQDPRAVEQKTAWEAIKASTDPKDFFGFLDRFPTGELAEAALSRLNQIARPQITASVGKDQSATLAYTGERFRRGDVFAFRVYDRFTDRVIQEYRRTVVSIDEGVVQMAVDNGSVMKATMLGATIEVGPPDGKIRRFDPPLEPDPAEFYVGRRFEGPTTVTESDGSKWTVQLSSRIVGTERIVLPAGTFDTYIVDLTLAYSNGNYEQVRKWVDPRYGISVRRDTTGRTGGKIYKYERRELVSVQADRS